MTASPRVGQAGQRGVHLGRSGIAGDPHQDRVVERVGEVPVEGAPWQGEVAEAQPAVVDRHHLRLDQRAVAQPELHRLADLGADRPRGQPAHRDRTLV
jgi:hypothetical protein